LDEAVGAKVNDLIDPETIAKIGHLDNYRRYIECDAADAKNGASFDGSKTYRLSRMEIR
jgi:hypothetical protein